MSVFFKIFKILNIFLILVLVSCSSKNIKKENTTPKNPSEQNQLVAPNTSFTDINSTIAKNIPVKKVEEPKNPTKVSDKKDNNIIDIPSLGNSNYDNIKKYGVSASTLNLISNGLIVIDGLYFSDISLLKQKNKQIIINAIDDKNIDSDSYIKTYFPSSSKLAISKFKSKNKVSPAEMIGFANYIGANTVIVKAFYVNDLSAYVYEISFLSSNLNKGYWNTTLKDAEPIENTLKLLRLKNLNSFLNITAPLNVNSKISDASSANKNDSNKEKNTDITKKPTTSAISSNEQSKESPNPENSEGAESNLGETPNNNPPSSEEFLLSEELEDVTSSIKNITATIKEKAVIPAANKNISPKNKAKDPKEDNGFLTPKKVLDEIKESAKDNEKYQFAEDIVALQRKLIAFRMDTVVGYWVDILTNEIYEILQTEAANKNNDFKATYSGYIILNNTKYMKQRFNNFAPWKSEDLAFQFKIDGSKAFYINNNKMINNAMINVFNAKGVIAISLPNGREIYLSPLIADLKPEVYNDLYLPIKNQYNNKSPEAIRKNKINISDIDPIIIDNYSHNSAVNTTSAFVLGTFSIISVIALFFLGITI